MAGKGKLDSQVEPDKALEEEPGGGFLDKGVLLCTDSGVPMGSKIRKGQTGSNHRLSDTRCFLSNAPLF